MNPSRLLSSFWLLLFSLLLPLTVLAHDLSLEARASTLPACAAKCAITALSSRICSATNQTCICTNQQFQLNVTTCVLGACTIPEQLATRNASLTSCGAPVRNRSQSYATLSNVMAAVAAAFVVMRFAFKILVTKAELGMDDWSVLATMVAATPSAIITIYGMIANGLGRDIWTLTPDQITRVVFYFYIMTWLYFLQVTLVKLALIFFYMRVFPSKGVQRVLWGTVIFTSLWGASFIITAIFQCRPISYFWNKWDGFHEGTCANSNAIGWANAAMSIALDLWILAIPTWQLRELKMHWKKKIGVALMFCVGTFVTVVSILRLQSLVHFAATSNVSWEFYDVSVWSTIEICVGIMCACMPTLRLILVRLFPVLAGSSHRSKGYQYDHSGSKLGNISGRSGRSHAVGEANAEGLRMQPIGNHRGIIIQTTYDVQRGDIDEASLISKASRV